MENNLDHYRNFIVDFENPIGDKLTITTVGNNKYPTLGIQKKDSCEIHKIGTLLDPVAFIRFMKGVNQDER